MRVMIVDDCKVIRTIVRRMLRHVIGDRRRRGCRRRHGQGAWVTAKPARDLEVNIDGYGAGRIVFVVAS